MYKDRGQGSSGPNGGVHSPNQTRQRETGGSSVPSIPGPHPLGQLCSMVTRKDPRRLLSPAWLQSRRRG